MSSQSAGGLHLGVRLEMRAAHAQIKALRAELAQPVQMRRSAATTVTRQAAADMKTLRDETRAATREVKSFDATLARTKGFNPLASGRSRLAAGVEAAEVRRAAGEADRLARRIASIQTGFNPASVGAKQFGERLRSAVGSAGLLGDALRTKVVRGTNQARDSMRGITTPLQQLQRLNPWSAYNRGATDAARTTHTVGGAMRNFTNSISGGLASLGAARSGNVFYALAGGARTLSGAISGAAASGPVLGTALVGITVAALASVAAVGSVVFAVKELAQVGISSAANLETLEIALTSILGSADRARSELAAVQNLALASPFDFGDVLGVDRTLAAFGIVNDQLRRGTLQAITDIGAAGGKSADELSFMARALGQVFSSGQFRAQEALQLINQGIPAYTIIAESLGITVGEVRKQMELGKVSAEQFFTGFQAYAERFKRAAEEQANTTSGLIQNIREKMTTGIGVAFNDEGTLDPLRLALMAIRDLLYQIDFTPIARSFRSVFTALAGSVGNFLAGGGGAAIQRLFENTLPRAIAQVGTVLLGLKSGLESAWRGLQLIVGAFRDSKDAASGSESAIKSVGDLIAKVGALFALASIPVGIFITAVKTAVRVVQVFTATWELLLRAILAAQTGRFWELPGLIDGMRKNIAAMSNIVATGMSEMISIGAQGATNFLKGWNSVGTISVPGADRFSLRGLQDKVGNVMSTFGPQAEFPDIGGNDELAKQLEDIAREMQGARNELFDLTKSYFGLPSQVQKGLFGTEGFESTVDQISSTAQSIIDSLQKLGQPRLVGDVARQTEQLIALARMRDVLADRLKDAEQKLTDATNERNRFHDSVRDSILKFGNNLKLEESTVLEVLRTDAMGSYIARERKQSKSFVSTLRDRLTTIREFISNTRALKARGLDSGLLEEILSAGPEGGGALAKELAGSSDKVIGEVNDLQGELRTSADTLGADGAKWFRQAGVDQAQGLVDGLKSQQAQVTWQAALTANAVRQQILPLADQAKFYGAAIGQNLGNGIGNGVAPGLARMSKAVLTVTRVTYEAVSRYVALASRASRMTDNPQLKSMIERAAQAAIRYGEIAIDKAITDLTVNVDVSVGNEQLNGQIDSRVTTSDRKSTQTTQAGSRR